jgi:hypothetical protein
MQKGNALKILNILHKALLMGQILFAAGCIYIVYTKTILPPAKELDRILQVAALIITVAGVYAGITIFKKKLILIREMPGCIYYSMGAFRRACHFLYSLPFSYG